MISRRSIKRRAQIALIIVIILVVGVAIFIFGATSSKVTDLRMEQSVKKSMDNSLDLEQIQLFGDKCVEKIIEDDIRNIYGENLTFRIGEDLLYTFTDRINNTLKQGFQACFLSPFFEKYGYSFIFSSKQIRFISINSMDIRSTIIQKIDAKYKVSEGQLDIFRAKYPEISIKELITSSQAIVNDILNYTTNIHPGWTNFDLATYCVLHSSQYLMGGRINLSKMDDYRIRLKYNTTQVALVFNVSSAGGYIKNIGACP
jgi:hypothetical protein